MLSRIDLAAMGILAAGLGGVDIARPAPPPDIAMAQLSAPTPRPPDPDIRAGRDWLERQAAERNREFREQQRQQADRHRLDRLDRRLDTDPRLPPDRPGWPGR